MSLARATWDLGTETWIVFYGSSVKRYRAFEVLLVHFLSPCPTYQQYLELSGN